MDSNLSGNVIKVEHWPSELPLFVLVLLFSIGIWIFIFISIIGLIYAIFLGLFFFMAHLMLITYIRGSAVRLGPDQFPEIYNKVKELSEKAGITKIPEAYIMQSGGALNAFATKFLKSKIIVLYTDLIEACGDNHLARDMIIGHELGHIKANHLKWQWIILPGLFFPFLGSAYSRAREFTCDRYGAALCGNRQGAITGLTILAAGGKLATEVNHSSFVNQQKVFNSGFMTIGKWLGSYPPLSERISTIEPTFLDRSQITNRGSVKALTAIIFIAVLPIIISVFALGTFFSAFKQKMEETAALNQNQKPVINIVTNIKSKTESDLLELSKVVEEYNTMYDGLPSDESESLSEVWNLMRPGETEPIDSYDGFAYGYKIENDGYIIWSTGPDKLTGTEDDLYYKSK